MKYKRKPHSKFMKDRAWWFAVNCQKEINRLPIGCPIFEFHNGICPKSANVVKACIETQEEHWTLVYMNSIVDKYIFEYIGQKDAQA